MESVAEANYLVKKAGVSPAFFLSEKWDYLPKFMACSLAARFTTPAASSAASLWILPVNAAQVE
jgi:hypothetical protein